MCFDLAMAIKASSAREIETLVADLQSKSEVAREAAVARLAVLGARSVDRLMRVVESEAVSTARVAALRALEAIGDPRALNLTLQAVNDRETDVASAAVSTARLFLRGARGAAVVDRLTTVALDRSRNELVRAAAVRAVAELGRPTIDPLLKALAAEGSDAVRLAVAIASRRSVATDTDPDEMVSLAADRGLPDDPEGLVRDLARSDATPLPRLLRLVERIREREPSEPAGRRAQWVRARGAAHLALARRGSRIGLYDLRETLEGASAPLPVEFLAALSKVGDVSCLDAIAAAYSHAAAGGAQHDWWRDHLADAFRAIVARERITKRHAVMKRIQKRWPQILVS